MLEWIISSSVLILIMLLLRALFRSKMNPLLQYALWGIVLIRLLLPISFGSTEMSAVNLKDAVEQQPAVESIIDMGNVPIVTQSYEDAYQIVVEQYESEGIRVEQFDKQSMDIMEDEIRETMEGPSLWDIMGSCLLWIWIAGIVAVSAAFLYTNIRFRKHISLDSVDTGMVKESLPIRIAKSLDTPCLFGLIRPVIYITKETAKDDIYLRHTVEHEYVHYLHKDNVWSVLRGICVALHWYNPLVWYAAGLSQRDGELACDEATINRLGDAERAEYGRTLIRMTCRKKPNVLVTATTMNASAKGIKERIHMIAQKPKTAAYTLVAILLVAAIAVGCTFTGGKQEKKETPTDDQLAEFFSSYIGEGRPTAGSFSANYIGSTDQYALVFYTGTDGKLILYRYEYADGQFNVLSAADGEYKTGKGITVNHLPIETGHLYFGTVADVRALWKTLVMKDEDGKEVTCALEGKAGYLCILESPLVDFRVINQRGDVATNYSEFKKRDIIHEVGNDNPDDLQTTPTETTKPIETTQPFETTSPTENVVQWPFGDYSGADKENPPVFTVEGSDMGPLYREKVYDKVCISIYTTYTGEYGMYLIPENQEEFHQAFVEAYVEGMRAENYSFDVRQSWRLFYKGEEWYICKDGSLYNWSKDTLIPKEATGKLIALCEAAVRQVGIQEPVKPEEITQLRSATLQFGGTHTLTDAESLEAIRELLVNSKEIWSAACPFTALLTLELDNGKTVTVAMATDSCGAWMSEGSYYRFDDDPEDGSDGNMPFYKIFMNKMLYASRSEDMSVFMYMQPYFSWEAYSNEYGYEETVALMHRVKNWISQDFMERKWLAFNCIYGLDGEYKLAYSKVLSDLFYAHKSEFASHWRDDCYDSDRSTIAHMLADYWNTDAESAGETLLAAINE